MALLYDGFEERGEGAKLHAQWTRFSTRSDARSATLRAVGAQCSSLRR